MYIRLSMEDEDVSLNRKEESNNTKIQRSTQYPTLQKRTRHTDLFIKLLDSHNN